MLFRVKLPFAATGRQDRTLGENPQVVSGILHKAMYLIFLPQTCLQPLKGCKPSGNPAEGESPALQPPCSGRTARFCSQLLRLEPGATQRRPMVAPTRTENQFAQGHGHDESRTRHPLHDTHPAHERGSKRSPASIHEMRGACHRGALSDETRAVNHAA